MNHKMTYDERVDVLAEVLEKAREAAEALRMYCDGTDDEMMRRYALPQFEGAEGGWLGTQAIDHVQNAYDALVNGECEECGGAMNRDTCANCGHRLTWNDDDEA